MNLRQKFIRREKGLLALFLIALLVMLSAASAHATDWAKTFGGGDTEIAHSSQQTSDGGYIVAGYTYSYGAGSADVWVLKLDAGGNITWQRTYGGTGLDEANSIQQTSDGGYIVAGTTDSSGAGLLDMWVLKLDAGGNINWQRTYGGTSWEIAFSVQQTSDMGYIVAGCNYSNNGVDYDLWVLKLDASGNPAWQRTYGGAGWDIAYSIQQTADLGYIVAGTTDSSGAGLLDMWVLKLDASGNVTWQRTFGGPNRDIAYSIQQTADTGYIVSGIYDAWGVNRADFWAIKLNSSGNPTWQRAFGGANDDGSTSVITWPSSESASTIRQTTDGGYIFSTVTDSFGAGGYDMWVVKLDSSGNTSGCSAVISANTTVVPADTSVTAPISAITVNTTAISLSTPMVTPQNTNATQNIQCSNITQNTLTVTKAGTGTGTVASSPAGIDCGATCNFAFDSGTVVTLTAIADAGSTFTGWSGGGCSGTGTCIVPLTADTTVTATFTINQYTLTVAKAGTGTGTVTATGIDCGSDCTELVDAGTVVTLTAAAGTNSTFAGWSGGGCTGTGTCSTTINADTTVTATFNATQYALTVTKSGAGNGTVTSNPVGISCGADCSESYTIGSSVTLTATADASSTFTGWSGGGCAGTATCTVAMNANTTVNANFIQRTEFTLTVNKTGTGRGYVASDDLAISCGADCTDSHEYGDVVTLTATPESGSYFTGWSGGGCSGTGACTVTITGDTTVMAVFDIPANHFLIDVNVIPHGAATIIGPGISCPGICSMSYLNGVEVTLNLIIDDDHYSFSHWTGCDSVSGTTCVVTMNAYKNVTANFNTKPVSGSDLTGEWLRLTQRCKEKSSGLICTVTGKLKIRNAGTQKSTKSGVAFFLSDDPFFDSGDFFLKKGSIGKIKQGKSKSTSLRYKFKENISGRYILAIVDAYNTINEIDETNNIIVYGPIP